MSERRPDFMVTHDPGCNCWPHVSQRDAVTAIEDVALAEYRDGLRRAGRAIQDGLPLTDLIDEVERHLTVGPAYREDPYREGKALLARLDDARRHLQRLRGRAVQDGLDVDWDQVSHDMHRHFWPGSVAEVHTDPNMGDCYKCRRMGDWLRARLAAPPLHDPVGEANQP